MPNIRMLSPWNAEVIDPRARDRSMIRTGVVGSVGTEGGPMASGGPPMPVAVEKRGVSDLPFSVTLDDGDSPMPTRKLSQLREVELVARLSESGVANKQDGDIESKPVRVTLPAKGPVELVIGN